MSQKKTSIQAPHDSEFISQNASSANQNVMASTNVFEQMLA